MRANLMASVTLCEQAVSSQSCQPPHVALILVHVARNAARELSNNPFQLCNGLHLSPQCYSPQASWHGWPRRDKSNGFSSITASASSSGNLWLCIFSWPANQLSVYGCISQPANQ